MKKQLSKYLILFIAALIAGFFFLRPSVTFSDNKPVLEKGYIYPYTNYISSYSGELTPEAKVFDTSEVGDHVFHYKIKKGFMERDIAFAYEVKDTIAPRITLKESIVLLDPGEMFDEEDIRKNVILNEGTFDYDTDYDSAYSGIYNVNIRAKDDYGNESDTSFNIVIRDTEAPMVLAYGDGGMILKGEAFDIMDFISYGDNTDPDVKLTVEGNVDTSKVGYYPLHIILEDASGNKTEWSPTIQVVSKMPKYDEPEEEYYPFDKFLEDYKGEGRHFGIDVSTWQGEVDYEAAKKAGCEFVIIRIGYSYKGRFTLDDEFDRNLANAKKAGVKVGAYLFTYDRHEIELLSSLQSVFDHLGDTKLDLPLVFDWEDFMDFPSYKMSFKDLNHLYDVFVEAVEQKGYEAMLYGSKYYLQNIFRHTDERDVWLAQYTDWPSYTDPYQIWQLSDHGQLDGIDGYVDLDILFGEEQ